MPEMVSHAVVPGRADVLGAGFTWEERTTYKSKKEIGFILSSLRVH